MSNIKIYGLLENATTDNKLAQTSQIYDETLQKFQSEINSQVILQSEKGKADGVATLDSSGKIPTEQIPGMFDDVVEFENFAAFPETGETGKIYVALDTNISYRWSGSTYIKVGSPLELGETSTTAYAGDKGKATTDKVNSHVSNTSNPHSVTKAQVGLGNVDNTSDSNKPVSTAQQEAINNAKTEVTNTVGNYTINGKKINTNPSLVKADVGLGNVDNTSDTNKPISTATQNALNEKANISHTHTTSNITDLQDKLNTKVDKVEGKQLSTEDYTTEEKNKLSGIAANANNYTHPAGNAPSKTEGFYKFSTDGNSHIATATPVTKSDITALGIPAQDTTYTEATTSKSGLMSSGDKTKIDKILTNGEGTKFLADNGTYKEISGGQESVVPYLDLSSFTEDGETVEDNLYNQIRELAGEDSKSKPLCFYYKYRMHYGSIYFNYGECIITTKLAIYESAIFEGISLSISVWSDKTYHISDYSESLEIGTLVKSDYVVNITPLTQSEYDSLPTKQDTILYLIKEG